ncbi:hypothetical protein D9M69_608720 [compost metagenome]
MMFQARLLSVGANSFAEGRVAAPMEPTGRPAACKANEFAPTMDRISSLNIFKFQSLVLPI